MSVCNNCRHRLQYHKKIDGHSICSVNFCACKQFIEVPIAPDRAEIHQALDDWLDKLIGEEIPQT